MVQGKLNEIKHSTTSEISEIQSIHSLLVHGKTFRFFLALRMIEIYWVRMMYLRFYSVYHSLLKEMIFCALKRSTRNVLQ